jgi:hypothetical protein
MSRKRSNEDDLYDMDDEATSESSSHLEKVMGMLEDSGIEFSVKKVANGKSLILENEVVFRFNHDEELTAVE